MSSIFANFPIWLIPLILITMSILTVTIIIERTWVLFKKVKPINTDAEFKLIEYIKGHHFQDAISFCTLQNHPAFDVVLMILEKRKISEKALHAIAEEAVLIKINQLEKFVPLLGTISTSAPLVGLLGTVIGMIKAFNAFGKGAGGNSQLFTGIDEILITTALGLAVAIPSLVMYNFFTRRIEFMIQEMNFLTDSVLEILKK